MNAAGVFCDVKLNAGNVLWLWNAMERKAWTDRQHLGLLDKKGGMWQQQVRC